MKKYVLNAIPYLMAAIVIYAALVNIGNTAVIKFSPNIPAIAFNTAHLILIVYLFGLLTCRVQSFINKGEYKNRIEFYARRNEKLAQQNEIDADDKEAMQRKIASLEIALDKALKNKEQP